MEVFSKKELSLSNAENVELPVSKIEKSKNNLSSEAESLISFFERDQEAALMATQESAMRLGFSKDEVSSKLESTGTKSGLGNIGERASIASRKFKQFLAVALASLSLENGMYAETKTLDISQHENTNVAESTTEAPTQSAENITKGTEKYWLSLDEGETIKRFPEYANLDFAQYVLEHCLEKNPIVFLENADSLKEYIDYKGIIKKAVEKIINFDPNPKVDESLFASSTGENEGRPSEDYLFLITKSGVNSYKVLDNYKDLLEQAAELALKNSPVAIFNEPEMLFEYLSPTSAQYFFEKATYSCIDTMDPLFILINGTKNIKKYLPDADSILLDVMNKFIINKAQRALTLLLSPEFSEKKVFSDEKRKELIDKAIEEDPANALLYMDDKTISDANPIILDYLKLIQKDESMSLEEKEQVATFVDELIYDKHLTPKELLEIIKMPAEAKKLAEEIISQQNCIGRQGLTQYLASLNPSQN